MHLGLLPSQHGHWVQGSVAVAHDQEGYEALCGHHLMPKLLDLLALRAAPPAEWPPFQFGAKEDPGRGREWWCREDREDERRGYGQEDLGVDSVEIQALEEPTQCRPDQ